MNLVNLSVKIFVWSNSVFSRSRIGIKSSVASAMSMPWAKTRNPQFILSLFLWEQRKFPQVNLLVGKISHLITRRLNLFCDKPYTLLYQAP